MMQILAYTSGVDISISYQYYRYTLAYRNTDLYFEYRNIFQYFSEKLEKK